MSDTIQEEKEKLEKQLVVAHGKVEYTYTAHHKIEDRLEKIDKFIRTLQIIITAVSTVGFLATVITNQILLSWVGGVFAALSLGLNIYSKDFKLVTEARAHKDAADELWVIKNEYENLITDIDGLDLDAIREKRNKLQSDTDIVNKRYPGTDRRGYRAAQKALQEEDEQTFDDGEAERFLP